MFINYVEFIKLVLVGRFLSVQPKFGWDNNIHKKGKRLVDIQQINFLFFQPIFGVFNISFVELIKLCSLIGWIFFNATKLWLVQEY